MQDVGLEFGIKQMNLSDYSSFKVLESADFDCINDFVSTDYHNNHNVMFIYDKYQIHFSRMSHTKWSIRNKSYDLDSLHFWGIIRSRHPHAKYAYWHGGILKNKIPGWILLPEEQVYIK